MENYGVEVRLLRVTPGLRELIEWARKFCYDTQKKTGTRENWIQGRVRDGHERLIEHASATFWIKASRVLTHELVRHRIASYSQRSQRYVKENEAKYITPPELAYPLTADFDKFGPTPSPEAQCFAEAMVTCWKSYRKLLAGGIKPEIARYVLPGACETQIVMTMNFRELRHFIKLRTSPRALPEIRCVAGKVRDICKDIAPEVFADV